MLIVLLLLLPPSASLPTAAGAWFAMANPRAQEPSAAETLQAWEEGTLDPETLPLTFAHLRGRVDGEGATRLARMLANSEIPQRTLLLSLLLQVPIDESRSVLQDFARDESRSSEERGRVAEFLLLLDGASAYDALKETVRVDAEPPYLRRFFAGWRESIRPQDLARLESLAREAEGYVAQYALQLWARHETDAKARARIYLLARDSSTSYRQAAVDALAMGGPDPVIARMLREELDGSTIELRRLARRMLPRFDSPEALLLEYQERAAGLSVNLRGRWMIDLAALNIPEAQRLAMEWLVDGGWNSGTKAEQVVMLLGRSAEVDALLPVLLQHEEIPERVLFPLALLRASTSADARDYLRRRLPEVRSVRQMQIVRAFGGSASPEDLLLLRDVAESPAYADPARAVALEMLVATPAAAELVALWITEPLPLDYELAAAWLRALAASGEASWVDAAVELADKAQGFVEEDERRGLRLEVWGALGRSGNPAHRERFEQRLLQVMESAQGITEEGVAWESLYLVGRSFPELSTVAEGLRNVTRASGTSPALLDSETDLIDSTRLHRDILLVAASSLVYAHPSQAELWFQELLARDLPQVDRLRVQGLRAQRMPELARRREATLALLEHPEQLDEWRLAMVETFAPDASSWTLFGERLQERALVDGVALGEVEVSALAVLLDGYADDGILARASDLAAAAAEDALAIGLASRRVDHSPLSDLAHAHFATLLEASGQQEKALEQWAVVTRLAPDRSPLWLEAKQKLGEESQ